MRAPDRRRSLSLSLLSYCENRSSLVTSTSVTFRLIFIPRTRLGSTMTYCILVERMRATKYVHRSSSLFLFSRFPRCTASCKGGSRGWPKEQRLNVRRVPRIREWRFTTGMARNEGRNRGAKCEAGMRIAITFVAIVRVHTHVHVSVYIIAQYNDACTRYSSWPSFA